MEKKSSAFLENFDIFNDSRLKRRFVDTIEGKVGRLERCKGKTNQERE